MKNVKKIIEIKEILNTLNNELNEALKEYYSGIKTPLIEQSKIHPLNEIEEYLGFEKGYLQTLIDTNPEEYIKAVFFKYTTLIDYKVQELNDRQLDFNGNSIAEKLKEVADFFREHKKLSDYTPEDVDAYEKIIRKLDSGLIDLWDWKFIMSDIQNFNEAVTHAVIYYAIKKSNENLTTTRELVKNENIAQPHVHESSEGNTIDEIKNLVEADSDEKNE